MNISDGDPNAKRNGKVKSSLKKSINSTDKEKSVVFNENKIYSPRKPPLKQPTSTPIAFEDKVNHEIQSIIPPTIPGVPLFLDSIPSIKACKSHITLLHIKRPLSSPPKNPHQHIDSNNNHSNNNNNNKQQQNTSILVPTPVHLTLFKQHLSRQSFQDVAEFLWLYPKGIETLDFGGCGIGDAECEAICNTLAPDSCVLKKLLLDGNRIGGTGAAALGSFLAQNATLTHLSLRLNSISDPGFSALSNGLERNNSLRNLCLSTNGASSMGLKSLSDAITKNKVLKVLDISGNDFGDEGIIHLSSNLPNSSIQQVNLTCCGILSKGGVSLGIMLQSTSTLEDLFLAGNSISDEGAVSIANALHINTVLRTLDLTCNSIGDNSAFAFAHALTTNKNLRYFNLSENLVTTPGLLAIGNALMHQPPLHHYSLEGNQAPNLDYQKLVTLIEEHRSKLDLVPEIVVGKTIKKDGENEVGISEALALDMTASSFLPPPSLFGQSSNENVTDNYSNTENSFNNNNNNNTFMRTSMNSSNSHAKNSIQNILFTDWEDESETQTQDTEKPDNLKKSIESQNTPSMHEENDQLVQRVGIETERDETEERLLRAIQMMKTRVTGRADSSNKLLTHSNSDLHSPPMRKTPSLPPPYSYNINNNDNTPSDFILSRTSSVNLARQKSFKGDHATDLPTIQEENGVKDDDESENEGIALTKSRSNTPSQKMEDNLQLSEEMQNIASRNSFSYSPSMFSPPTPHFDSSFGLLPSPSSPSSVVSGYEVPVSKIERPLILQRFPSPTNRLAGGRSPSFSSTGIVISPPSNNNLSTSLNNNSAMINTPSPISPANSSDHITHEEKNGSGGWGRVKLALRAQTTQQQTSSLSPHFAAFTSSSYTQNSPLSTSLSSVPTQIPTSNSQDSPLRPHTPSRNSPPTAPTVMPMSSSSIASAPSSKETGARSSPPQSRPHSNSGSPSPSQAHSPSSSEPSTPRDRKESQKQNAPAQNRVGPLLPPITDDQVHQVRGYFLQGSVSWTFTKYTEKKNGKKETQEVILDLNREHLSIKSKRRLGKAKVEELPVNPTLEGTISMAYPGAFTLSSPSLKEPMLLSGPQRELFLATIIVFIYGASTLHKNRLPH